MPKPIVALMLSVAFVLSAAEPEAAAPTPAPAHRIDLSRFTIDGVGLESSEEDVRKTLGAPEETQRISAAEEMEEDLDEEKIPLEKREPEKMRGRVIYSYFKEGFRVVFEEEDMSVHSMDIFIEEGPPYAKFEGAFVQPIPLEVREVQLLRPLAKQIYKDRKNMLFLKKDDSRPRRQIAQLTFNIEGWLTKITFRWEENYDIDLDRLCVAGVCIGEPAKKAMEILGPPDRYRVRGKTYLGMWNREGLRIYASKKGEAIRRIAVGTAAFDGGFVQPLALMKRKEAFHEYLGGRIYQESSARICAYRKSEPLSGGKAVLSFDEDDRLRSLVFEVADNIHVDFDEQRIAGVRVGDGARKVRSSLGRFSKWRELRDCYVIAYPRKGVRVFVKKKGEARPPAEEPEEEKKPPPRWADLGEVTRIEAVMKDCVGLYASPFSLADTMAIYRKKAADRIFSEKGDAIYMSADGHPPNPGVAATVAFEKVGWPQMVSFREFRDIVVDMKKFTVAGIGLGTHADEVQHVLGKPKKARTPKGEDLTVFYYEDEGLTVVIDRKDRKVTKINIYMDAFEGSFAQDLTVESNADDYEKALHAQIYKQDEKTFRLTRDGAEPTWDEAVVYFGLGGDVDKISFLTLDVKRESIIREITKELE